MAMWIRNQDSHVLAMSIALFLTGNFFAAVVGAPAKHAAAKDSYYRYKPCTLPRNRHNRNVPESSRIQANHMNVPENVRIQFNVMNENFQKLYSDFRNESKIMNFTNSFSWLKTNTKLRLEVMHKELQVYAATIHHIIKTKVSSNISKCKNDGHYKYLRKLEVHLKTLLCEVETAILNKPRKNNSLPRVKLSDIALPRQTDCTGAMLNQSMVIKSFNKLMENILRKMNKKRKNLRKGKPRPAKKQ